jgi:hypothetical protein
VGGLLLSSIRRLFEELLGVGTAEKRLIWTFVVCINATILLESSSSGSIRIYSFHDVTGD